MTRTLPLALLGLTLLAVGGCNQTMGPGNPNIRHYQQNTIDASHPRMRLVLGSEALVGNIALVDVRLGDAGGLPRAEVSVQNLTNNRYTLEYQFAWEDKEGFSIPENRVWKRFVLGPREIRSFQSLGANPDAWSATFTVRIPDDVFIHQHRMMQSK